ncbi:RlmE family RNA methyltransferase [Archaeoglobus sulfaticallidus]|uniref:RlmE family RNA methyltransferase n=1 Tax=Archaeoglobus sulfaticallidus TaxID=1316941 RepID=UPI00064E7CA0|nr:SAM-dependent methyltransferase [Archaeoglobus sulfaticallidus]
MSKPRRSQDRQDYYYWKAKKEGYRSRAAYKLIQINKKFRLIKEGDRVLDLGASPGGWSQVAVKFGAEVVAVDLNPMPPIEGVTFVRGDITKNETFRAVREICDEFDVVISDAAPKLTGKWTIDHLISIDLARASYNFAEEFLRYGGNFLVKVFQGEEIEKFYRDVSKNFRFKKMHSPQASRKRSAEIYFIGKGFKKNRGPVG